MYFNFCLPIQDPTIIYQETNRTAGEQQELVDLAVRGGEAVEVGVGAGALVGPVVLADDPGALREQPLDPDLGDVLHREDLHADDDLTGVLVERVTQ